MTEELVRKWSEIHGFTKKEAAEDVKLWIEIYMKKAPAPTEAMKQTHSIITDSEAIAYEDQTQMDTAAY